MKQQNILPPTTTMWLWLKLLRGQLKGRKTLVVHSFGVFGLGLLGYKHWGKNVMTVRVCGRGRSLPCGEQESKSKEGTGNQIRSSKHIPNDPLPPTRYHLLKFPELPKVVPIAKDQTFSRYTYWGHFILKTSLKASENTQLGSHILPTQSSEDR